MSTTRREFIRNGLGAAAAGIIAPSMLLNSPKLWADESGTMYLFVGLRTLPANTYGGIWRYIFDPKSSAVLTPAPAAGQSNALWGVSPTKDAVFQGIAIAPNGDVYAVSSTLKGILRFDGKTGVYKNQITSGLESPDDLAIGADGNLYIADWASVKRYTLDGTPLPGAEQTGAIFAASGLREAQGITFGKDGTLYVSCQNTSRILRIDGRTGETLGVFCAENVFTPSVMEFGADGNLYVACAGGSDGFSPKTGYIARVNGTTGKFMDIFAPDAKGAIGLSIAPTGDLFVTDYWNGNIARFDGATGKSLGIVMKNEWTGGFYHMSFAKQGSSRLTPLLPVTAMAALSDKSISNGLNPASGWRSAMKPNGTPGPFFSLANNKKTDFVILTPKTPTPQDKKAAAALAWTLLQMTGATFPIMNEAGTTPKKKVISIGRTELLKSSGLANRNVNLGKEGYAIAAKNSVLFLFGGSSRGAINAVYSFLEEDLDCRWYAPMVSGSFIPKRASLGFKPMLRHHTPVLDIRDPYYCDAFDADWSLKNRTSSTNAPVPNEWGGYPKNPPGYFVHTYDRIMPPEKYFKDHPEYYAEIDGKRQASQLDLSNPDVLRITVETVKQVLQENPGSKYLSVSPNDGRGYCECQYCSALDKAEATVPDSHSGSLMKFVNQVAEAIAPDFPDVKITTLAYLDTFMPPKTLRPRNNVSIQLCTDSHAWRYPFLFVTETEKFQTALKAWHGINAEIHIWDYTTDFAHYLVPFPDMPAVIENVKFYMENGAKGVMLQGNYSSIGGENSVMRSWVWAKQLWDPTRDTHALMRDFIYGYFGSAAGPIWAYNEMLWNIWQDNHAKPHMLAPMKPDDKSLICNEDATCTLPPSWAAFTPEFLDSATKYFSQAESLAKNPEIASRVKVAKMPLLYIKIGQGLGFYPQVGSYVLGSWEKHPSQAQKEYYAGLLSELLDIMRSNAVDSISESSSINKIIGNWQALLKFDWNNASIQAYGVTNQWKFRTDPQKVGVSEKWFLPQAVDASWTDIRSDLGGINGWENQGFPDYKGYAWYQQTFTAPAELKNAPFLYLYFGAVDSQSEIYINGEKVFEHTLQSTGMTPEEIWNAPFAFDPRQWLKFGEENTIAVRVTSAGGVRGIWDPVYLLSSKKELDTASLALATMTVKSPQ